MLPGGILTHQDFNVGGNPSPQDLSNLDAALLYLQTSP
jgi:hypothetical protein